MVKRTGPKIEPYDTPFVTGINSDWALPGFTLLTPLKQIILNPFYPNQ